MMPSKNSAPSSRRKRAHAELDLLDETTNSSDGATTRSLLSSPLLQQLRKDPDDDKANTTTTTTSPEAFSAVGRNLMSSPLFPRNKEEDEEDTKPMDSTIAAARPAGELVHEQGFPPLKEHDVLLRQVSTWMEELTRTREDLQRASVRNAILLDRLYMTGAIEED